MSRRPDKDGAVRTPLRATRIDDDLWEAAKAVAASNGETVTNVIRRALREYIDANVAATNRTRKAR